MDATGRSTKRAALPQEASTAAVASVFGNGDLLRDILLCLNFPTYLVHAALVSKHWLRHASDPVFLRRFRQLHPPCLLGFFVVASGCPKLHRLPFEPMLLPEDGGDGTSCTAVALMLNSLRLDRVTAKVEQEGTPAVVARLRQALHYLGLSRAEGSGFYLIHVKLFQIRVWLYSTDDAATLANGSWLIQSVCIRRLVTFQILLGSLDVLLFVLLR